MRPLRSISLATICAALIGLAAASSPALAAPGDPPIFVYTPPELPESEGSKPKIPPDGTLEGPCGLAVGPSGSLYVSEANRHRVDAFAVEEPPEEPPNLAYAGPEVQESFPESPCAIAADGSGHIYVNNYHRAVLRFGGGTMTIDPGPATGLALDPVSEDLYVNEGTQIAAFEPSGAPIEVGGQPLLIGQGSLSEGYGLAVSGYPATEGFLYVADAADDTVKVYDPATDLDNPVEVIDPGFSSLTEASLAVDDATGELYVVDDLQPEIADEPEAVIDAFDRTGAYEGQLYYRIIDALPAGLAVDNTGSATQGRLYVTSGTTEGASIIAYLPDSAGASPLPAPEGGDIFHPGQGGGLPLPEPPPPVTCVGDSCQHLPSEPSDPTLTSLLEGAANPPVRFHDTNLLPHYSRLRHHHHGHRAHRKGATRHPGHGGRR